MTTTVHAVYEKGTLRLAEPISLAEGAQVEVVIIAGEQPAGEQDPSQVLAGIAARPMQSGAKGFSGREHDQVLYGEKGAR